MTLGGKVGAMHADDLRVRAVFELVDGQSVEVLMQERELEKFAERSEPMWLKVEGFGGLLDGLDDVEVARVVSGGRTVYARVDLEGLLGDIAGLE